MRGKSILCSALFTLVGCSSKSAPPSSPPIASSVADAGPIEDAANSMDAFDTARRTTSEGDIPYCKAEIACRGCNVVVTVGYYCTTPGLGQWTRIGYIDLEENVSYMDTVYHCGEQIEVEFKAECNDIIIGGAVADGPKSGADYSCTSDVIICEEQLH